MQRTTLLILKIIAAYCTATQETPGEVTTLSTEQKEAELIAIRSVRQNPNLSKMKTLITSDLEKLRKGV